VIIVSSWPPHAELAIDADNCRHKRRQRQSRHSIFPCRCCPPLPPWRKSPVLSPCCLIPVTAYQPPRTSVLLVCTWRWCTGQIPHPPTVTWSAACRTHAWPMQPTGIQLSVSNPMVSKVKRLRNMLMNLLAYRSHWNISRPAAVARKKLWFMVRKIWYMKALMKDDKCTITWTAIVGLLNDLVNIMYTPSALEKWKKNFRGVCSTDYININETPTARRRQRREVWPVWIEMKSEKPPIEAATACFMDN